MKYYSVFHSILINCLKYMTGGTCGLWFGGRKGSMTVESGGNGNVSISTKKRSPFSADLFGSVCYSFQHGQFKELYADLTRVDARLDICSASAFAQRFLHGLRKSSVNTAVDPMSSPRLNLIFQQQVFLFLRLHVSSF